MTKVKVLITGITGFLGSKIAERLILGNFEVIGLKRAVSNAWRCRDFTDKVFWVEIDDRLKKNLLDKKPDIIIHCAWMGVETENRNNWKEQINNINFLTGLLEIADEISIKKIIFLGSQAEYGRMCGKVNEENTTEALDAYAGVKLACLEIAKAFCSAKNINWVWLRVFSVFGEKENETWLIPSLIKRMQSSNGMDFTVGEQKYAYLYVLDFANAVHKIVECEIPSGIYNLSGNIGHSVRNLVESIRELVSPSFKLNFGAIPYRRNQSMYVVGDTSKLKNLIGEIELMSFESALHKTIAYYLTK